MIDKIKIFFWKFGNSKVCPICKSKLKEKYEKTYICLTPKCKFNGVR